MRLACGDKDPPWVMKQIENILKEKNFLEVSREEQSQENKKALSPFYHKKYF